MNHHLPFLMAVIVFMLNTFCLPSSAFSQGATATLSGTVEDEGGAVVPGVTITVINLATSALRQATTNGEGYFIVPLLPPSRYQVTAESQGFPTVRIPEVILNVNDQKGLVIQLKVGSVGATVDVREEAPLINESPAVGTIVDRQFIANIPINGRSFQSLMTLAPGVVLTKSTFGEQGQFSVNGQRAATNYFMIDGVSANFGVSGSAGSNQAPSGALPALSAAGSSNNLVSVDALQEFKVLTSSYAPEFGRTPGAQVSIVTRSGTNDFHGSVFEYFRHNALDATDWFVNANRLTKPPLRQNDFGGVLGGPILLPRFGEGGTQPWYSGRNRTFFFFSFEALRLRLPQVKITDVPSLAARSSAVPLMRPFLNAFPVPNGPTSAATSFSQFAGSYSEPSSLTATSIRLDHAFNARLTLFGRYNYAPSESISRAGTGTRSVNSLNSTNAMTQTVTLGSSQMLSPNVSNELRANYSKNNAGNVNSIDNFGGAVVPDDSILYPAFASPSTSGFTLNLTGGTNSSWITGPNGDNRQNQLNLVNNFLATMGSHQIKIGADYRRLSPEIKPLTYSLIATFSSVNMAIAGRATTVNIFTFGSPRLLQVSNFSAYAQDTWQATRSLVLTYGVRWEVNPSPKDTSGTPAFTVTGLDNPATFALATPGTTLYRTTYNNFAPRVGLSYQLLKKQGREIVVRGGFGVFFDTGNTQSTAGYSSAFFPYNLSRSLPPNSQFPVTNPALLAPPTLSLNPPFGNLLAPVPDLKLPYTLQWNLALEQSLGSNQTLSASYIGAAGRRLLRILRYTPPIISPNFTGVFVVRNLDASDYHAMQLQLRRRLARGLQALASYSWSHSIDTSSVDSSQNPPDVRLAARLDRGSSDFDVRQAFTAAATYDVPPLGAGSIGRAIFRDFALDANFIARSATPINVISFRNIGFGNFPLRPDLVTNAPLYLEDSSAPGGRRFNPAAFDATAPANAGRQGTLGRNILRGFPVTQFDLAVRRELQLIEGVNLQLRAEVFNVFNHPNFADPIGTLTSTTFGRSTSMLGNSLGAGGVSGGLNPLYQIGGPRSIQLALKLLF